jgi:hypothetical protein
MLKLGNVKLFLLHAIKLLPLIITINLGVELEFRPRKSKKEE